MAAARFEGLALSPENHLRFAVALAGTALTLFAVLRPGPWPRLLYLVSVGYLAYFAAGSAWGGLWRVGAVAPTDGAAEILALTLELAARLVIEDQSSGKIFLALARIYDLALMPLAQLVTALYLARVMLTGRPN
jgi:hypothetical protein